MENIKFLFLVAFGYLAAAACGNGKDLNSPFVAGPIDGNWVVTEYVSASGGRTTFSPEERPLYKITASRGTSERKILNGSSECTETKYMKFVYGHAGDVTMRSHRQPTCAPSRCSKACNEPTYTIPPVVPYTYSVIGDHLELQHVNETQTDDDGFGLSPRSTLKAIRQGSSENI